MHVRVEAADTTACRAVLEMSLFGRVQRVAPLRNRNQGQGEREGGQEKVEREEAEAMIFLFDPPSTICMIIVHSHER